MKHSPEFDNFFRAILTLETEEECYKLFEDICTVKELEAISQRLEVASQLSAGKNYNTVSENTGASSATISRVNKCLLYGDGGYQMVLERMGDKKCS
jgi:TrpR-related protein YerC/YecD